MLEKHWKFECPWLCLPSSTAGQEESAHEGVTRTRPREEGKAAMPPVGFPADVYSQSSTAGKPSRHWNPHAKAPRDIWAISRMVSDKSSLSFYSLWVWVCGWGLLLHKSSTRCAEKSVKSRILKAFSIAPSFDENSKQTTHKKKYLSFHPFKRANSLQSNKKNVKEKKLGLNLFPCYKILTLSN